MHAGSLLNFPFVLLPLCLAIGLSTNLETSQFGPLVAVLIMSAMMAIFDIQQIDHRLHRAQDIRQHLKIFRTDPIIYSGFFSDQT